MNPSDTRYPDGNLFDDEDVVKRYEEFLVTNVKEEVPKKFAPAFDYINKKIFFPENLWAKNCEPPQINIIDFGIGAGKFTLPYVKKLESTIVGYSGKSPKIKIFGVDSSQAMLKKLEVHKAELGIKKEEGIDIKLCPNDINKHSEIKEELAAFMPEVYEKKQEKKTINIILFAQTIHYLEEPKKFFDSVIASMNSCYILHFLPILYLKYMDGNFSTDDEAWDTYQTWDEKREDKEKANFNKERQALHKRFWRYFFALRDGYRNYSDQLITATNEEECFKWYKEKGLYKISENIASIWDKKITFDDLLGLIEKPIFSAHSIGLEEAPMRERIKDKIVDEFKEEIEKNKKEKNLFNTKVPFGYRFSLHYYKKGYHSSSNITPKLNESEAKKNNHGLKIINSALMQEVIKSKFQNMILYYCGISYINKFEFPDYKPVGFTNLDQWDPFLKKLQDKKIKSVAEIVVEKELKNLVISQITETEEGNLEFREIDPLPEESELLKDYVKIFHETSPKTLTGKKGEDEKKLIILYFPIFSKDIVESIFINFIFTFVLREEKIDLINGDSSSSEYPEDQIKKLIRYIEIDWKPIFLDHQKKIRERFKEYSVKSSIAAIMSRNMSHNLGSHVIADLVANGEMGGPQGADLNVFFRYLQNRMDFIAQITTEFPEWTYPAYFNKEVMRIFYENHVMLDRIGVSEGLRAYEWPEQDEAEKNLSNKIIVRTAIGDQWIIVHDSEMGSLDDDLQLAIPGGIVGYHAIYVIIENVIRNSAKHGFAARADKNKPLIISIRIDQMDGKDYVWATIWDDIPQQANNKPQDSQDQKEEEYVPELVTKMNSYLKKSFVGETGELQKENWGIAELKICAGFLQNRTPAEIGDSGDIITDINKQQDSGYPQMIIKAVPVTEKGVEKMLGEDEKTYFLGYRFWIKKPRAVALVGEVEKHSNCEEQKVENGG